MPGSACEDVIFYHCTLNFSALKNPAESKSMEAEKGNFVRFRIPQPASRTVRDQLILARNMDYRYIQRGSDRIDHVSIPSLF